MSYNYDREGQIQHYNGLPKSQDEKEVSLWGKFIKAILPWVTKKWELGNAYLEAKVAKEKNEADKIEAETLLLKIQAEEKIREIVEIASQEDELNAETIEVKTVSEENIEDEIKDLVEKIKLMHLKYGLKISISIENGQLKAVESEGSSVVTDNPGEQK